jgi:hypothetical protein
MSKPERKHSPHEETRILTKDDLSALRDKRVAATLEAKPAPAVKPAPKKVSPPEIIAPIVTAADQMAGF